MDGVYGELKILADRFEASRFSEGFRQNNTASSSHTRTETPSRSDNQSWVGRKLRSASLMLSMFSLRGMMPWSSVPDGQRKVELTVAEVECLRSELADLEEREAHLKARLEHIDQMLRSARLSGYLYIRTRWTALPGEPPTIDDNDVDDWLPRFAVLQGPCIFFYLSSTDIGPQDSTLLSDIVEIGNLPNITREDGEMRYAFYMLARQGLRYECSSISKIQVDSWMLALQSDLKLRSGTTTVDESAEIAW